MTATEYKAKYDPGCAIGDDALDALLAAARAAVETYLGRGLQLKRRTEQHWSEEPRRVISLHAWPVTAIESVTDANGARSDYILLTARGQILLDRPVSGQVTVTYTGGLEPIPADIEQAEALIVSSLSQAQQNGGQTVVSERLGDWQATYSPSAHAGGGARLEGLGGVSMAAMALLDPYRARRV